MRWAPPPCRRVGLFEPKPAPPAGPIHVFGVCVPWADAHVCTGQRNRRKWQDHETYLDGLSRVIATSASPLLLIGDFNQTLPRTRAPEPLAAKLDRILAADFLVPTRGMVFEDGHRAIDHLAIRGRFRQAGLEVLQSRQQGAILSDHQGYVVDFEVAGLVAP